jgi:mRNA interferase RelE/StbE
MGSWEIDLAASAKRDLRKLDPQVAKRVLNFLNDRIAKLDNPRGLGKVLLGPELEDYWRYRVGDWRIIADIDDDNQRILVAHIDHRRKVYRRGRSLI